MSKLTQIESPAESFVTLRDQSDYIAAGDREDMIQMSRQSRYEFAVNGKEEGEGD